MTTLRVQSAQVNRRSASVKMRYLVKNCEGFVCFSLILNIFGQKKRDLVSKATIWQFVPVFLDVLQSLCYVFVYKSRAIITVSWKDFHVLLLNTSRFPPHISTAFRKVLITDSIPITNLHHLRNKIHKTNHDHKSKTQSLL